MIEPPRRRLPDTRKSVTRRVQHAGELDLYITVGFYSRMHALAPGEVFVKIGKEGSTLQAMVDLIAIQISMMLQYGIPWGRIADKLVYTNFEPLNNNGESVAHVIATTVTELIETKGRVNESQ